MLRVIFALVLASCPLLAHAAMPYDAVARLSPPGKMWGGSCVLIYKAEGKGLVVTNAHVVAGSATFDAVWSAGKRTAKVVGFLPEPDLAFLVVDDPPVDAVKMGLRDSHIIFAGYPHYERDKLHWQYGNYIADEFPVTKWRNMPVPGMSGGAVFDRKDGELCGLVRAGDDGYGWGVCDILLITMAHQYENPDSWVPNGKLSLDDKRDWKFAEPSKVVVTKDTDEEEPPTWE